MHKIGFALLCVLALCLTPVGYIRIAVGHADYDRSEPAADGVVNVAPTQVRIWFTQEVFRRQGANRIEVARADGTRVDLDDTAIDDDDRRLMTVSLTPELGAGVYTVRWRALSAEDGHEGEGEFRFTIETAATTAASTGTITEPLDATAITDSVALTTATDPVTDVVDVTGQAASAPTSTLSPPTAEATATVSAAPVSSPPAPSASLPCLGGAVPLVLALGAVVVQRRRRL